MTSLSPGNGERMSRHSVPGGEIAALLARFEELGAKALKRTGATYPLIVIQEAGVDGFWVHRCLAREEIESHVVEAASVATSRRARRAKTDRLNGEALVRTLLAYKRGGPRVCAMVAVPDVEDEGRRRIGRERQVLIGERIRHVNRIKGLLFFQGIDGYEPLCVNRRDRLDELRTGDGRPLPEHMKRQIGRELDRLEMVKRQIDEVNTTRDAMMPVMREGETPAGAALLLQLRGASAPSSPASCTA